MLYSHGTLQDLYTTKEATQHEIDEKKLPMDGSSFPYGSSGGSFGQHSPGHDPAAGYKQLPFTFPVILGALLLGPAAEPF